MYSGYLLTENSRAKLLEIFPPKYSRIICHHITEKFDTPSDEPVPQIPKNVQVTGYIDSGDGVEGLLVKIDGSSIRPDGNTYHITLSISENRKPKDTNDYIQDAEPVDPINIMVIPKIFK